MAPPTTAPPTTARRVVRLATPATLTGVRGRPTLACASLTPIDKLPSADGPIESVAALTNAVHANAATARLEAFIVFLLWVRAATINDSPVHPIDLDQGSGSKKPREEAFGHFRAIGAWPSRVARSYLAGLIEAASF